MKYKPGVAHASRETVIKLLSNYMSWSEASPAEKEEANERASDIMADLAEQTLLSSIKEDYELDGPDLRAVLLESLMLVISLMRVLEQVSQDLQKQYPGNRVLPVLTLPLLLEGLSMGIELISIDEELENILKKNK